MFSLIFVVVAVIGWAINMAFDRRRPRTAARTVELALLWTFGVLVGAQGIVGAFFHVFFAQIAASSIGWKTSPFQFENAMGDLATGVLGVLCIWFRGKFWLATGIAIFIQLTGDAIGHVYQLVVNHDTAPDNAGLILYTDFGTPLLILVLGIAFYLLTRQRQEDVAPASRPATTGTAS